MAGHRYNNNRAVRFLCRQGPDCVDNMLIERAGVDFDRNEDGTYNLTREGGHGAHRILHRPTIPAAPSWTAWPPR